jgi:hypothetical protein
MYSNVSIKPPEHILFISKAQKPRNQGNPRSKAHRRDRGDRRESQSLFGLPMKNLLEKARFLRHWQCRGRADGAEERTKNMLWAKLRGKNWREKARNLRGPQGYGYFGFLKIRKSLCLNRIVYYNFRLRRTLEFPWNQPIND